MRGPSKDMSYVANPTPGGLSSSEAAEAEANKKKKSRLTLSFCLMIVIGSGNKIFQKLQTIPMYNYPNFLNLLTTFVYIPLSFMYIIPVAKYGWLNGTIDKAQLALPKKPFAVMGFLDCIAGIMQIFAATYLPGSYLILLSQMAIPTSMLLSKKMLGAMYQPYQYVGAVVVFLGIIIVLGPVLNQGSTDTCQAYDDDLYCSTCQDLDNEDDCLLAKGDGDLADICNWSKAKSSAAQTLIWAAVMILSCIPMTLSSIYKEIALGETELDPIFLNGWIAVFQFFFSIPLAIPAALAGSPSVSPSNLPKNMADGAHCYLGKNTIDTGCNPDDCARAPVFVNTYLFFNVSYNILIMLILKFGSANILWLAMTVMVPIGNLAFALPFMPSPSQLRSTDIVGLFVIMGGLVLYRFGENSWNRFFSMFSNDQQQEGADLEENNNSGKQPLLSPVNEVFGQSPGDTIEQRRTQRINSEEPEKVGGIGRVGKSF